MSVLEPTGTAQPSPVPSTSVFEKFDMAARRAIVESQEVARRDRSDVITVQHLLAGVLHTLDAAYGDQRLASLGLPIDDLLATAERWFPEHEPVTSGGHIPFHSDARTALAAAMSGFIASGAEQLGTEHLALGAMLAERNPTLRFELAERGLTVERVADLMR